MSDFGKLENDDYVGHKVFFRHCNGKEYTGFIQDVDDKIKSLTLFKVSVNGGPSQNKLLQFFSKEIVHCEIQDEVNEKLRKNVLQKEKIQLTKKEKGIHHSKENPKHLEKLLKCNPQALTMKPVIQEAIKNTTDETTGKYESMFPEDCTFLDDYKSDLFKRAIEHLKTFPILGVLFEGIRLGRNGQLCWILMSTGKHTMFFDVQTMGKGCFDAGIKDILIATNIEKVIHDCRAVSDILCHQYDIRPRNIFDTMVAAAEIYKMEKGAYPRYTTCLQDCLYNYLRIFKERLHYLLRRQHAPELDEEVWSYRPAPTLVYEWLLNHCMYLVELRHKLDSELKLTFRTGVDIFLRHARDVPGTEAVMRAENKHMLPSEFDTISYLTKHYYNERQRKNGVPEKYQDGKGKDADGFLENCAGISHPAIVAGHDSIWHTPAFPKRGYRNHGGGRGGRNGFAPSNRNGKRDGRNGLDKEPKEGNADDATGEDRHSKRQSGNDSSGSDSERKDGNYSGPSSMNSQRQGFDTDRQRGGGSEAALSDARKAAAKYPLHLSSSVPSPIESSEPKYLSKDETAALKRKQDDMSAFIMQEARKLGIHPADSKHRFQLDLRPAGEMLCGWPKQKKKQGVEDSNSGAADDSKDLGSRKLSPSVPLPELNENEFDLIPSHTDLKKNRARQPIVMNASSYSPESHHPHPGERSFHIDDIKESIPPPVPYSVLKAAQDGGRSQPDTFETEEDALAAILPTVSDKQQLLSGSRTSVFRPKSSDPSHSLSAGLSTMSVSSKTGMRGGRDESVNDSGVCADFDDAASKERQLHGVENLRDRTRNCGVSEQTGSSTAFGKSSPISQAEGSTTFGKSPISQAGDSTAFAKSSPILQTSAFGKSLPVSSATSKPWQKSVADTHSGYNSHSPADGASDAGVGSLDAPDGLRSPTGSAAGVSSPACIGSSAGVIGSPAGVVGSPAGLNSNGLPNPLIQGGRGKSLKLLMEYKVKGSA